MSPLLKFTKSSFTSLLVICNIFLLFPSANSQENITVIIQTGHAKGAGTDANVSLGINNDVEFKLNERMSGNVFEKGCSDTIMLPANGISDEITHLWIGHDDKYPGSDWFLGRVIIITPSGKKETFQYNNWIKEDKADGGWVLLGFRPNPEIDKFLGKNIYFKSAIGEDKYLDVQWGRNENGTPLHLWTGNRGPAQQFRLTRAGENHYYISSRIGVQLGSTKYLHVQNSNPATKTPIVIWETRGADNTKWKFEKVPNTNYFLIKSKLGTYLDVKFAGSTDGTPIWTWTRNAGIAQRFEIQE